MTAFKKQILTDQVSYMKTKQCEDQSWGVELNIKDANTLALPGNPGLVQTCIAPVQCIVEYFKSREMADLVCP